MAHPLFLRNTKHLIIILLFIFIRSIKNLNDKEILLENASQKKTDQILEEDSKFTQV